MLQTHAEAMESSTTVYHEFLLYYKAAESVVYGFVEGKEDLSFYQGLIEALLPTLWAVNLIHAGNRAMVLKLYNEFDWNRFPINRICFFIDRDLSLYLNDTAPVQENWSLFTVVGEPIEPRFRKNRLDKSCSLGYCRVDESGQGIQRQS